MILLAASAAALAAAPPPVTAPARSPRAFAAELSRAAPIVGPSAWRVIPQHEAWAALASAPPGGRQAARWALARSLIGSYRGPEALGVLETMRRDDAELGLVPSFTLALAAASVQAGDTGAAVRLLTDGPHAPAGPEACAWRLRAFKTQPDLALAQIKCALPALNARSVRARRSFLIAAAESALAAGRPQIVNSILKVLPQADLAAGLCRGRAALLLGDLSEARRQLGAVQRDGRPQQRVSAELTLLEHGFAAGTVKSTVAGKQAERLAFVWRGDAFERRSLLLSYKAGIAPDNLARRLGAGAALVRHFPLDATITPILAELQSSLGRALATGSSLPIDRAAGLYWEYRDLAPAGAAGDYLVSQLADRLQERGLYVRAADLLKHLLFARTKDITQGPLSVRVGSLYILAGRPGDALKVMRATDAVAFPEEMSWARRRIEAVALLKLGRVKEALAVIQDVPDAAIIRAEIFWQRRDWAALEGATADRLPAGSRLGPIDQVIVLRHAIALAMLGREPALAALRARYLNGFAGTAAAPSFDALTRDAASLEPQTFTRAMLALPRVSPVTDIGDLFDAPSASSAS